MIKNLEINLSTVIPFVVPIFLTLGQMASHDYNYWAERQSSKLKDLQFRLYRFLSSEFRPLIISYNGANFRTLSRDNIPDR